MLVGSEARTSAECRPLESPAGWGVDNTVQRVEAPEASRGQGVGELASGAKKAPNRVPDDAVESLEMIVLLIRLTPMESCREIPPPSQPETLLAMMLLVAVTVYQRSG